ncbi:MAG: hypothetical protein P1Q69_10385 [Candidatus Thorarchaeota archaeon]|nr:hypothetical protein [Candidatus Thorarchaeota archaeon]
MNQQKVVSLLAVFLTVMLLTQAVSAIRVPIDPPEPGMTRIVVSWLVLLLK